MPQPIVMPARPTADWPSGLDSMALIVFVAIVVLIPAAGYFFMIVDIRDYYRSLRRALVVVTRYVPGMPQWAKRETPRCLEVFGLSLPCTIEDLMASYRQQVKELHPDRGGDRGQFLVLQGQFEQAQRLIDEEMAHLL